MGSLADAITWLVVNVPKAFQAVVDFVSQIPAKIKAFFSTAGTWLINAGQAVITGLWNGIKSVWHFITNLGSEAWNAVTGALSGAGSWLYNSGRSIIEGFWRGIQSMIGWVRQQVSGFLSSIRDLWPFSPAKEGPFSGRGWVLYSGMSVGDAFGEGITRSAANAVSAARGMLGSVSAVIQGGADGGASMGVTGAVTAGAAAPGGGTTVINLNIAGGELAALLQQGTLRYALRNPNNGLTTGLATGGVA